MSRRALIVVDVQNDFVDGSLGTARGAEVAAAISSYFDTDATKYDHIVGTLDWHIDPSGHFVAEGEEPDYSETWPVHCVAGSDGAKPFKALHTEPIEAWFRKGEYSAAYSGFEGYLVPAASALGALMGGVPGEALADSGQGRGLTLRKRTQSLEEWLKDREITHVDVVGIATDFCVKATALDAQRAGFHTTVIEKLCAPVSEEGASEACEELRAAGVLIS
ncbi:isochorismatase family protein [Corynebacterium anserum]|uniref:nicotinamidase n=1 Tax=Corynebacterium anserum TaxID=2684406 RepID=A0A7G7YPD3_9CORY|nr:isochorismatase family protein [Corynebacterium anserum]MBC2681969.1 isochorismatase family protein [Corynebacterium anserum]QNH96353.1 isochorismatase family protein [Corynebacterium anserum]